MRRFHLVHVQNVLWYSKSKTISKIIVGPRAENDCKYLQEQRKQKRLMKVKGGGKNFTPFWSENKCLQLRVLFWDWKSLIQTFFCYQ